MSSNYTDDVSDRVPVVANRFRSAVRPAFWWLAGRLPLAMRRQYLHTLAVGRPANLRHPRTFNEEVHWRVLHDRRQAVADACDKLRMKETARGRIGPDELRIAETLWSGIHLEEAPDLRSLPSWVLKPNHSSGHVVFGPDGVDPLRLAVRTESWLRSQPAHDLGEWGYRHARPLLLIEERIPSPGESPTDYKFFVFGGVARVIQVNSDRFGTDSRASFYDTTWNRLPVRWASTPAGEVDRPADLELMVDIAERLGQGWDFIRVDLYNVNRSVWFGEFTPYPGGGVMRFEPSDFDQRLGQWWTLPPRQTLRREP